MCVYVNSNSGVGGGGYFSYHTDKRQCRWLDHEWNLFVNICCGKKERKSVATAGSQVKNIYICRRRYTYKYKYVATTVYSCKAFTASFLILAAVGGGHYPITSHQGRKEGGGFSKRTQSVLRQHSYALVVSPREA